MRKSQKSIAILSAVSGTICSIPGIARANDYAGNGAVAGTNNNYVTIESVDVTNDATNLYFQINLDPTSQATTNNESWGKYDIGFQLPGQGSSGNTTVENPYSQPIGVSTGMNYWVGSWTNEAGNGIGGTGGAALYQYSGSTPTQTAGIGTTNYIPMPVGLTNTSVTVTVPLASVGMGNASTGEASGGVFNFDAWTTFDAPGGQGAYSVLDNTNGSQFTTGAYDEPWDDTAYDSATAPNSTFSTTTYTMLNWNNSGTGGGDGATWSTSTKNWSNGGATPVAYSDTDANGYATNVVFTDNNNSNYNVNISGTMSPGSTSFGNSSGNYTLSGTGRIAGSGWIATSGTGTVVLANTGTNTYTGATTVNAGTLVIGAKGALPANNALFINNSVTTYVPGTPYDTTYQTYTGTVKLAPNTGGQTLSSLTIAPTTTTQVVLNASSNPTTSTVTVAGGTLDITNNHVIINYTSDPKTTILGYLSTGSNGGAWNGPGIISSTAAGNPNYGVGFSDGADGVDSSLSSGQIEVAYAQYGDITLSGLVNAQDFQILANNFGHVVTDGWEDGDFSYSGTVNAQDFNLLAQNFGHTETGEDVSMPASDWAAIGAFAAANDLNPDVPEPAALSLTALAGAALLSRRRRQPR